MASFSGIKNTLLAEQVEEQLYEYITKLPMKAGDKLPNEFKLAEMCGVARSPVGEAVKLLVSRNVLETRRGSGTYVKDLVPTDLDPLNLRNVEDKVTLAMNLVDLRLILEPGIAELAAYNATDEEIVAAAKAAHADSFIRRLPDGYDTVIAEDGGNISQGQKQLLCIARVMLCLPPMLILDEATSSIDTRTEVRIQAAFARMMQGRTSFIVAHRLSTIREADVILVMKDGHIVEQGNHDELLAQGGFYAKLYNSQFEGVET